MPAKLKGDKTFTSKMPIHIIKITNIEIVVRELLMLIYASPTDLMDFAD